MPALRAPEIPMIPDTPISWATMMLACLVVIDVSTQIGEYHSAIKQSTKWGKDDRLARQVCKTINIVVLQVVAASMLVVILSATVVTNLTEGMDTRMVLVLEGISRLEASFVMTYVSVKLPRWIGVYHSSEKDQAIQHVGEGLGALKFHVRYSIGQYFLLVWCMMLPFTGRPISALLGFAIGFLIELLIAFARKGDGERQFHVASAASLGAAFLSSVMCADGCHYIQIVWGSGQYFSEWGLGIASFAINFATSLLSHFLHLQQTVRIWYKHKRISIHEQKEGKMAISIIRSHIRSEDLSESQRAILQNEMEQTDECAETTWSLVKQRLSSKSDLVFFGRFEYFFGIFVSLASLFVVVVNIVATDQMNVVRKNFHHVHTTLYGDMDAGPVCAFDKIGGTVRTFDSSGSALAANQTIAHCGACGHCSTWQDLRLQYTTRTYLAKESQRCAKKSFLFGREAVHDCLMEEPIGFTDQCAECWTTDIYCARSNCAFIFIQANLINTVSNFAVGEDTITSATCEEANCELEFVPCSGANRRRMNIQSTIARPGRQLCNIVGVEDWEDVFGERSGLYKGTSREGTRDEL